MDIYKGLRGVSRSSRGDSRRQAEKKQRFLPICVSFHPCIQQLAQNSLRTTHYALRLALLLLLFLVVVTPTQAQNAPGLTLTVEAGFDGWYKSTHWLPVHISAANSGAAIDGELRLVISDGPGNQTVYTTPLDLPTQSDKRVTMLVKAPRNLSSLEVDLVANGRSVGSAATRTGGLRDLPPHTLLYGVITPDAGSFDFLANVDGRRGETAVAYLNLHHLPDVPPAWNSLDVLILHDTDSSQLSSVQRQALAGWIQSGGQLVVVGGPGWQPTSSGLADWLPVTPHGVENVNNLPALSQQAGVALNSSGPYLVTNSSLRQGELLWHEVGLPLLARRDWGEGGVYFLALDPTLAPLRGWEGQPILWQTIAGQVPDLTPWNRGIQNGRSAVTAVSTLAQRTLPTAGTLMIFMLIYIVLIGPVNYQILKRRGQREMAWVTIPILVLIFSAIAYATGFGLRGNAPILNQISIVTGQTGGEQARVQTIIGLYSPSRTSYEMVLPETAVVHPLARTPSVTGDFRSGSGHVTRDSRLTVSDIRTDIGSVETFLASSYQPAPDITAVAHLRSESGTLLADVEIVNNGRFRLEQVAIIAGDQVEIIGDLPAAASRSLQLNLGSITAASPTIIPMPGGFGMPQSPLMAHGDALLGGWPARNEPDNQAKFELFRALENFSGSQPATAVPPIFLVAWSDQPLLDLAVDHNRTEQMATTLYLLTIPLDQFTPSDQLSLSPGLLNWTVLNVSRVQNIGYRELYLNGGWIEFEYTPWPVFQDMEVSALEIVLQQQQSGTTSPAVSLWDWAEQEWVAETAVTWGNTPINDPDRYLNSQNSIRLRLEDQTGSTGVSLVYPRLTGQVAKWQSGEVAMLQSDFATPPLRHPENYDQYH
jgi:hypothetical protein